MTRIIAALLTLGLAACGMKGPLVLPPGPPPPPLIDSLLRSPAPPAQPVQPTDSAADVSTDQKPNTQ